MPATRLRVHLVLAAALLFLGAAGSRPPASPRPLTDGVWRGEMGRWVVALEFTPRGGRLEGVAHVMVDGRKWTEAPLSGVALEPPHLRWHLQWGPTWEQDFRGRVDLVNGMMVGEVSSPGRPAEPITYRRVEPEAVAGLPVYRSAAGERGHSYRRPAETGDGWRTATTQAVGLDASRIDALMAQVVDGAAGDIHSLLVVRRGRLVVEEYFRGWSRDDLHRTESCTKSVASLLVGIAIDRGRIEGVEAPVLTFYPELSEGAAPGWETVRLEHLLTMTAGLDRPESAGVEAPGLSLIRQVLDSRVVSPPGTSWRYANADVDLLAGVLRHATGVDAVAFAETHLFRPLGIEAYEWKRSPTDGYPSMAAGLSLRPRDMARIGALVAGGGRWQGRQLVSAGWVERATRVHQAPPAEVEQYGYLWWSAVPPGAPEEHRVVYAKGVGSQFIFVSPALDLVVTVTGGNHANGKLMAIAELLSRHLFVAPPPTGG